MKATIHYDTGDTSEASAIVSKISQDFTLRSILSTKGKIYILGQTQTRRAWHRPYNKGFRKKNTLVFKP